MKTLLQPKIRRREEERAEGGEEGREERKRGEEEREGRGERGGS